MAFLIAGLGYLALSALLSPRTQSGLWAALAFLVIPACAGLVTHALARADKEPRARFRKALRQCGAAMFFYAFAELIWLRTRFATNNDGAQIMFVWLFVSFVYALLAGLVAGLTAGVLASLGAQRRRA